MRIHARDLYVALVCKCVYVVLVVFMLSVSLVGNFTLPLKCKVQMRGETMVFILSYYMFDFIV